MQEINGNYADKIFQNGMVYSVDLDGTEHMYQAVGTQGGNILFCGSNEEAIKYTGPETIIYELDGKMVLPGFCDAHNHNQAMVSMIFALDLSRCSTKEEYLEAIADWRATNPECAYITGNGWSLPLLGNVAPRKEDLDAVCADIPLAFFDTTHHVLWANTVAIKNAGIHAGDKNPPGGVIEQDPTTGEPTGIFSEDAAIGLVMSKFPDFDIEQYKIALCAYQEMANAYGITMAQDCMLLPGSNAIEAYHQLATENKLTLRARGTYTAAPSVDGSEYNTLEVANKEITEFIRYCVLRRDLDYVGDLFQVNAIKLFEDGGGPTTYLKEPYEGSDYIGETVWPDDQLEIICEKARCAGFQIHVHAMGDGATSKTLDAFDATCRKAGAGNRDIITHLMLVDGKDINRMASQGVVAVVQPYWMCRDEYYSRMYFPLMGEERTNRFYPMKSLVDAGVLVAGSSDWPVTMPNMPLHAIQTGITRVIPYDNPAIQIPNLNRNPEYRYPLGPSDHPLNECTDFKTMVQSFTINGAYALFAETITGSIEPGKSADLVVLDRNLLEVQSREISHASVLMTIFRGETVYQYEGIFVADRQVVPEKHEPLFPGDPTPCKLIVTQGTDVRSLWKALIPPLGGSIHIIKGDEVVNQNSDSLVEDSIIVSVNHPEEMGAKYAIEMIEEKEVNSFKIQSITTSGCRLRLEKKVPNLSEREIFVINLKNKVSAEIVSITTSDGGLHYDIQAVDRIGGNGLEVETEYGVFLYDEKYVFEDSPQKSIIV